MNYSGCPQTLTKWKMKKEVKMENGKLSKTVLTKASVHYLTSRIYCTIYSVFLFDF